jgi:hypothetical protein
VNRGVYHSDKQFSQASKKPPVPSYDQPVPEVPLCPYGAKFRVIEALADPAVVRHRTLRPSATTMLVHCK